MKLGAEDKKKVVIMAALLVIAIPLVIYNFGSFGSVSGSSPAPATAPAPQPSPAVSAKAQKKSGIPQVREKTLDPTLRTDILAASQKIEYKGGTRNIFHVQEAPPPKLPDVSQSVRVQQQPQYTPPPQAPQIPLKYYGFSDRPGEAKKAFLQDGDNIFVAVEGQVVERRYKIVKITNTFVLVEDVLNNSQQNINLTPPQTTTG